MQGEKITKLITVFLLGVLIFAGGFYLGMDEKRVEVVNLSESPDLTLLGKAYVELRNRFPRFAEIEEKELVYGAIEGMVNALGDPHTSFHDPERTKYFDESVKGEFGGVGMEVGKRDGKIKVISPLKDTPAEKAGIRSGDIITTIDNESTDKMILEEVVQKIRGPEGESVTLEILRKDQSKEITITRELIKVPSLSLEFLEGNIAHLRLYAFHEKISEDFSQAAREIIDNSAQKIILDVRNNSGGSLPAAREITGKIIGRNEIMAIGIKEGEEVPIKTLSTNMLPEYPMVILVNKGSASASELLAGALRDHRNIPLVGETTFGKGSIQGIHYLDDGSSLKITESYFLTPQGKEINEIGLTPDYKIEMTEEDIEQERDPQLEKAIEILKEL